MKDDKPIAAEESEKLRSRVEQNELKARDLETQVRIIEARTRLRKLQEAVRSTPKEDRE